ncbi:hypothetical protein GCM10027443_07500 [Pontibacter brevis]
MRLEATVLQVENEAIRFKLYQEQDGPEYIISTLDVLFLDYADGTRRVFGQPVARQQMKSRPDYTKEWGRNMLTLSVDDFLHQNLTISYERIFGSGKFGIQVPVSVGLNPTGEDRGYFMRNKTFGAGVAANFYPFGQARFTYFLGPQADLSTFKYDSFYYGPYDPDRPQQSQIKSFSVGTVVMSNGVYYQLSKPLIIAFDIGLGARVWRERVNDEYEYYPYYLNFIFVPAIFRFGFRF